MQHMMRRRALAQAIARIHWSIAYVGLDAMLELVDSENSTDGAAMLEALQLVDEALAELRDAYQITSPSERLAPSTAR
jgi:hypothetical protein